MTKIRRERRNVADGKPKTVKMQMTTSVLSFRIIAYFSIKHYLFSFPGDAARYKRVARQLAITLPSSCCCDDEPATVRGGEAEEEKRVDRSG